MRFGFNVRFVSLCVLDVKRSPDCSAAAIKNRVSAKIYHANSATLNHCRIPQRIRIRFAWETFANTRFLIAAAVLRTKILTSVYYQICGLAFADWRFRNICRFAGLQLRTKEFGKFADLWFAEYPAKFADLRFADKRKICGCPVPTSIYVNIIQA